MKTKMLAFLILLLSAVGHAETRMNPDGYIGGFSLGLDAIFTPENTMTYNSIGISTAGSASITSLQQSVDKNSGCGLQFFGKIPFSENFSLSMGANWLTQGFSATSTGTTTSNLGPGTEYFSGKTDLAVQNIYSFTVGLRYYYKP